MSHDVDSPPGHPAEQRELPQALRLARRASEKMRETTGRSAEQTLHLVSSSGRQCGHLPPTDQPAALGPLPSGLAAPWCQG